MASFRSETSDERFADLTALAGGLAFLLHARYYALTQVSVLDEGAYLLKGLLFIRGDFFPFQDYGPLTNQMPFSFLLHGAVQALFGPGLREGRIFVLAVGLTLALGLWVLVRRYRGPWWAAFAVWALAINPATARFYSLATSQAIVACLVVWTLVLALPPLSGDRLPTWRPAAAAGLAAFIILVRINLAPVLILLIPFVFWTQGRRNGWWALAAGALVFIIGHALFWPGILKIWSYWLPDGLTPFLDPWRQPAAPRFWDPQVSFSNRFFSFLEGLRLHFLSISSLALAILFLPAFKNESPTLRRTIAFTAVLFAVLFVEHVYASLGLSYCVYCFSVYVSFFSPVGLFLLAVLLPVTFRKNPTGRQTVIVVLFIAFSLLLGLGAFDQVGDALSRLRVPRLRSWLSGDPLPGLPVWDVLETRFGLAYTDTRKILSATAGLLAGLGLAAAGFLFRRRLGTYGLASVHLFLAAGLLLTPTAVLGNGFRTYDCGANVLAGLEQTGAELAAQIPAGSRVYWRGGDSAVPLLYVPDIVLYPPQINGDYTIFDHPDADALLQFGLWSEALSDRWLGEADFVLVEAARYEGDFQSAIESAALQLTGRTSAPYACLPESEILVFTQH